MAFVKAFAGAVIAKMSECVENVEILPMFAKDQIACFVTTAGKEKPNAPAAMAVCAFGALATFLRECDKCQKKYCIQVPCRQHVEE